MSAKDTTLRSVRAALAADTRIDLMRHPLSLTFEDGVLTMEGQLRDVAGKKRALARAAGVENVHHIVDRLRVEPARPMSDAEIRDPAPRRSATRSASRWRRIRSWTLGRST